MRVQCDLKAHAANYMRYWPMFGRRGVTWMLSMNLDRDLRHKRRRRRG
jgi:hypothetical protein